jgi:glycosyltransferase involved in cell wall biosynthesis
MRLLIIGHTAHYQRGDQIVGWGPTVKEVNWLARSFDSLTHLACFHQSLAPDSALPYDTDKVQFVPVPPAGGPSLRDKLRVIQFAPKYFSAIIKHLPTADVIQVRGPGPLGLCAMLILGFIRRKIYWTKYAGNWGATGTITPAFAFQRWWLKNGFTRGPVTVNGKWPNSPKHIYPFDNPSLTLKEIIQARRFCTKKQLTSPIRLIFVGRIESAKGVGICLDIVNKLRPHFEVHLDVLGGGPELNKFQVLCTSLEIQEFVTFHDWVPHDEVKRHLAEMDFILLPSASEGWPKVLSEAMAYGVVPIASNVSAIPQILSETQTGFALPPSDADQYAQAIVTLVNEPMKWKSMIQAGLRAAPRFSYELYILKLNNMFLDYYHTSPMNQTRVLEIQKQIEGFYAS